MDQIDERGGTTTLIHFVYESMIPPTDSEPEGPPSLQWRIACMPNMTEFHSTLYHPAYQRTNSHEAVTCLACKKTAAYKERVR